MNIFQRAVAPQPQSLCFAEQWRQFQCSHQIHFRWFTSSTNSATIHRRITVRDTLPTVDPDGWTGNGPGGPKAPPSGPSRAGYQRRQPGRPTPPANRLISQTSAKTAATMKSQWMTKPAPKATIARMASATSSSIGRCASLVRPDEGVAGTTREPERGLRRQRLQVAAVCLARAWPTWWPLPAAAGLALAVLALMFVSPVVLEPLFNRFRPLEDERLAGALRALADRAGVPVRDVLVADASRRTTRTNAYVSGLGPTRRVVVWDTLLASASEAELALVVAHELGHRRDRHVVKGTLIAMAGAVVAVLVLRAALGTPQPGDFPLAALVFVGLELAGMPLLAWTSRRWERAADRCSLELTGDREAFACVHVALARKNLSDLSPPRLAYLMLFTHPTPPERLELARAR